MFIFAAKLLHLHNIPRTWTLSSLAKWFDALYSICGSAFVAQGLPTLKAIIEIGLKLNKDNLNHAFRARSSVQNGSSDDSCVFVEEFLNLTVGKSANFKKNYYQLFGKSYGIEFERQYKYADAARLLISWLTSYVILNVYSKFK